MTHLGAKLGRNSAFHGNSQHGFLTPRVLQPIPWFGRPQHHLFCLPHPRGFHLHPSHTLCFGCVCTARLCVCTARLCVSHLHCEVLHWRAGIAAVEQINVTTLEMQRVLQDCLLLPVGLGGLHLNQSVLLPGPLRRLAGRQTRHAVAPQGSRAARKMADLPLAVAHCLLL